MIPNEQQVFEELKRQIKDLENKILFLENAVELLKTNGVGKNTAEQVDTIEKTRIWEWVQEGFNKNRIVWKHTHENDSEGGPAFAELGGFLI